ncbi:uncharacterized protein LOC133202507 [Saccostrea echinata]|uniref:uncharacterized protein LOC133202507 n=1 Tax=Saccostrea echinata TaxID=191078 RepID=UPI002A7F6116|nr:uncharacterized protein LOC133202507 [Saccostrea echinata]
MHFFTVFILACTLFLDVSCFYGWFFGEYEKGCPYRDGANPYYFGTTHLRCILHHHKGHHHRGRRSAPSRWTYVPSHRFIEYKGYYYDFQSNSNVSIANSRLSGDVCSGAKEKSPAGYSELSSECIEGCAKNYRCKFGNYSLWSNNCHRFANRMSEVLCRRGTTCPDWCKGSCNDVEYN